MALAHHLTLKKKSKRKNAGRTAMNLAAFIVAHHQAAGRSY
jgi:hypothetical protein